MGGKVVFTTFREDGSNVENREERRCAAAQTHSHVHAARVGVNRLSVTYEYILYIQTCWSTKSVLLLLIVQRSKVQHAYKCSTITTFLSMRLSFFCMFYSHTVGTL